MRRIKISVLSMVLLLWIGLPLWWSPSTQAQGTLNSRLDGTYDFHLVKNCIRTFNNEIFDANLNAIDSGMPGIFNGFNQFIQFGGTLTFNGAGTASLAITGVVIRGTAGGAANQLNCPNFAYVVSADKTFTLQGDCAGTVTVGPAAGQTLSITNFKFKGSIGTRRRTLIFQNDGPNIETVTLNGIPSEQICAQNGTAVRIA